MKLRIGALACALAAVLAASATASAAPAKKPAKPLCKIGQQPGKVACTANPLFAKTICASFVPGLEALAPGFSFPAGYDYLGPGFSGAICSWALNGRKQAVMLTVMSLEGSVDQKGNKLTPEQAWNYGIQIENQSWDTPDAQVCPDGIKSMVPQLTTVGGYPAYTEDACPDDSGQPGESQVAVKVGDAYFHVLQDPLGLTSAQLFPFVQQVIAKYRKFLP